MCACRRMRVFLFVCVLVCCLFVCRYSCVVCLYVDTRVLLAAHIGLQWRLMYGKGWGCTNGLCEFSM